MMNEDLLFIAEAPSWAAIMLVGSGLLLYLMWKRLKEKKKETFEKRSN
jgi:hypothetical protein